MNKTNHSDFARRRSLLSLTEPARRCLLSTQHCLTRSVHFTGIAFLPRQYRRGTVHRWASLTALQSPPRVLSIVARLITVVVQNLCVEVSGGETSHPR